MLQPASPTPTAAVPLPELYRRVERHIPPFEWTILADDVAAILRLKDERNAVVLAHNYQTPDIFHTVADIVGDSLALAREAERTDADVIVLAGVHFMAETAKLLNPEKTVLIPDLEAGCSLAASITAADIRLLRERHPGVPIVTYVNTSAAVKAESDVCCTSGNAKKIIEGLGVPKVIMLPDEYLARNTAAQTKVEIIAWSGHCEVHERFTPEDIRSLRESHPGIIVLAHPECPPEVIAECDFQRLDRGDGRLCRQGAAGPRRAADRMLDERQCRAPISRSRICPALQPLPAHEADHLAEDPAQPRNHDARGHRRPGDRRSGAPYGRTHAGDGLTDPK